MKAETWYYTPCGRRMKQFPEIIKVDCSLDSLFMMFMICLVISAAKEDM